MLLVFSLLFSSEMLLRRSGNEVVVGSPPLSVLYPEGLLLSAAGLGAWVVAVSIAQQGRNTGAIAGHRSRIASELLGLALLVFSCYSSISVLEFDDELFLHIEPMPFVSTVTLIVGWTLILTVKR
jgi:hypothetical protein